MISAPWLGKAQDEPPVMVGIGDSLGEGVQSCDASIRTQVSSYQALIARQLNVPFPLPLIRTTPYSVTGKLWGRSRIAPYTQSFNLSVTGARVGHVLRSRADAASPAEFDSEIDLVEFPNRGSQIEIAEFLQPAMAIVWIGNNDACGSVVAFDKLDGVSRLTPVDTFAQDFKELADRLAAAGIDAIYGNLPYATSLGYLLSRADMIYFTGSDQGLAEGDYTTMVAMLLIRLGLADATLLLDPNWVLDATEAAHVNHRIAVLNQIVAETAHSVGAPVVDLNRLLIDLGREPRVIRGRPLLRRFNGGMYSLDGFHPSNLLMAIIANAFLDQIGPEWGGSRIGEDQLEQIALRDPFFDWDRDGQVVGRLGAGLLETIMYLAGFSGDFNEFTWSAPTRRSQDPAPPEGSLFRTVLLPSQGRGPPTREDREAAIEIFRHLFEESF